MAPFYFRSALSFKMPNGRISWDGLPASSLPIPREILDNGERNMTNDDSIMGGVGAGIFAVGGSGFHRPWWSATWKPALDAHFHISWAKTGLVQMAICDGQNQKEVIETHAENSLKPDDTWTSFSDRFSTQFPQLRLILKDIGLGAKSSLEHVYSSPNTGMSFEFDGDSVVRIGICTNSKKEYEQVISWWKENTTSVKRAGRVHVLVSTQQGPEFKVIGMGGCTLERENYSDKVLEGYDRIVKDLKSKTPAGRIAILNGQPGSGKTHIVKGLLNEIENAIMVIIPANLVTEMAQPGMIEALMNLHNQNDSKPMVFLIEDADEVLAPRDGQNISAVSAVLNLGDGILGQLLDVRIVATTNATHQELDAAILRPGRLSAAVSVGPLSYEKSLAVYQRLTGRDDLPTKEYTLAEIYSLARNEGWEAAKTKTSRMGFGT